VRDKAGCGMGLLFPPECGPAGNPIRPAGAQWIEGDHLVRATKCGELTGVAGRRSGITRQQKQERPATLSSVEQLVTIVVEERHRAAHFRATGVSF